jgi:acetyl esterase/lipase
MLTDLIDLISLAFSAVSALLATTILIRIRSEITVPLLPWKLFATALSPFLALTGLIGAALGVIHFNVLTIALGLYAAVIATCYVYAVTRSSGDFERVFGADWQSRIPPALRAHMLPRRFGRWQLLRKRLDYQNDVSISIHHETGDPILADIWQPPPGVPHTRLGLIYLHGSGWHYLKKDFYTRSFFQQLASQGHVIADVAYTMAPRATIREMLADVYRAVAWMKQNADSLGIDPERVVLAGGSAGAHLALLAAYAPDHPDLKPADVTANTHVRGVISYYGLADLRLAQEHLLNRFGRFGHHQNRIDRALMYGGAIMGRRAGFLPAGSKLSGPGYLIPAAIGGTPDVVPVLYDTLSPLTYVNANNPPTLLFHGSHDFALDVVQSRQLYAALRKVNAPAVYVEFPFTEHVFDLFFSPLAPAFQAATYDTERFLALLNI